MHKSATIHKKSVGVWLGVGEREPMSKRLNSSLLAAGKNASFSATYCLFRE